MGPESSPLSPISGLLPTLLLAGVVLLAYVKLSVALAVLRRGLGGDVLPRSLCALLALLLSVLAMAPLAGRCHRAMVSLPAGSPTDGVLEAGAGPLREYLTSRTPAAEKSVVQELRQRLGTQAAATAPGATPDTTAPATNRPAPEALGLLVPAFVLAELRVAFQLGFLLLLPFLLIDLLCASLLSGLLLPGLPARAVALPFKLLLFVLSDGWRLLVRGLLGGYA